MKIDLEVFPRPGESQFFGIASGGEVAQAFGTGATERDAALAAVHALYNAVPATVAERPADPGTWFSGHSAVSGLLRSAKENGTWLDIDYIDRNGVHTSRRALPVEFLTASDSVGVQTDDGYRALYLHRIQRVRRAAER